MGQNKEQVKYVVQAFELILCPFPTSNPSEPRPAPSSAPWSGLKPLLGHGCLASRRAMETSGLRAPCTAVSSVLLTNPPHRPLRSGLCQLPPGNINICRSKARTQGISRWRGSDAHGNGCLSCFLIRGSSVSPEEPSCGHLCHCPLALSNPGRVFHSLSISLHPPWPLPSTPHSQPFSCPEQQATHILCGAVGSPHPELALARTPAGPGPSGEEGCWGWKGGQGESSFWPPRAAASGKPLHSIKRAEVKRMTIEACQMH